MPEKGLGDISRALREQYEKGVAAIHRNNLDYAVAILNGVLKQEPGLYPAREALRAVQFKKAGPKGGFLKRMFGTASHSPLLARCQLALRSNPIEALHTAEQILNSDPNSVAAHKVLADAALAAGFPRTAVLSLEIAFKNAPDREVALRLGRALAEAGEVGRADQMLSDLATTFPNDPEIAQALKNIAAKRTLTEGGYGALEGGGGSYRDILRDKQAAVALEQEQRTGRADDTAASVIAAHEARLAQDPRNPRVRRALAERCAQQKQYARALALYQELIEIEGGSEPSLERAITETRLRQYEDEIAGLDPAAPDATAEQGRLEAERVEYELARARMLVEQYPSDLQIRFELGQVYFRNGRFTEAIQELQKAQNHPNKRVSALFLLGQCFAKRGILDLAARTLKTAAGEKPVFDGEKKDIVYALAGVLEQMGKKADAMEQYKLVYEVDIGYRDVAARVDAYYAGQG